MGPNLSTCKAVAVAVAPRTAYVTFLAGDGDYWKGVVGLAKGLRRVHAAYQLVVAVLPDVPESHRCTLIEQGCAIREIQPVYPPDNQTTGHLALSCSYNERDHINCYAKLCWISQQFPEFERAVYVDAARVQVLENVDDLVELDRGFLYAWTMECFGDKAPWRDTPRYKIAYRDEESPDMVQWNAADAQLAELLRNAAVIVHEPGMPLPGKNRAAELGALFHYTTVSARATSMPCDETLLGKNHAGELAAPYSNSAVLAHQPGMAAGEALRAKPASTYPVQVSIEQAMGAKASGPIAVGAKAAGADAGAARGRGGNLSVFLGIVVASSAITAVSAGAVSPVMAFGFFVVLLGGLSLAVSIVRCV